MRTALLILLSLPALACAELNIVTTTTDFADVARQIGRNKVSVHSIMKGPENLHNVIARPTEMVKVNQADLFVHSGLDAEPWRDSLLKGARNPRVLPGRPGNVDMSAGVELRDVPAGRIDRSMGDVHAYGNPHYQLSPANSQRVAATLVKAMADADPANADFYKANAVKFVEEMADVHREIRESFAPFAGLKVVTFHKAWDYFADAVPIEIAGAIEPQPSITPSAAQVRQIVDAMKAQDVRIVICETYNDQKLAQYVADQAGAKMIVLPDHVNGLPEASSYQELFRHNVRRLIDAAKEAGLEPAPARDAEPATAPDSRGRGDAR